MELLNVLLVLLVSFMFLILLVSFIDLLLSYKENKPENEEPKRKK